MRTLYPVVFPVILYNKASCFHRVFDLLYGLGSKKQIRERRYLCHNMYFCLGHLHMCICKIWEYVACYYSGVFSYSSTLAKMCAGWDSLIRDNSPLFRLIVIRVGRHITDKTKTEWGTCNKIWGTHLKQDHFIGSISVALFWLDWEWSQRPTNVSSRYKSEIDKEQINT